MLTAISLLLEDDDEENIKVEKKREIKRKWVRPWM